VTIAFLRSCLKATERSTIDRSFGDLRKENGHYFEEGSDHNTCLGATTNIKIVTSSYSECVEDA